MIKHLLLLAALPVALLEADGSSIAGALQRATATTAWQLPPPPVAPRASRPGNPGLNVITTEWRSSNINLAGIIAFLLEFNMTQVQEPLGWAENAGDGWIRTMLKNLLNSRFGLSSPVTWPFPREPNGPSC